MLDYLKLTEFIKKKRSSTGLSLNAFSIEYEMESSTLSRYETGQRLPKITHLIKIASAFNQTLAEFLTEFEKEYND